MNEIRDPERDQTICEYFVVGTDMSKERHCVFFGTARSKTVLRKLAFDNTVEGFEKLRPPCRYGGSREPLYFVSDPADHFSERQFLP